MSAATSLRFAYRHVRAGLGRRFLSVVALALGVALVIAVQLMNTAVLDAFIDTIDGMVGRADLTVTAGDGLAFGEDVVQQIAAVPGVALAVPLVTGVAFPDDDSGELLTVHGVDIANDAAVRVYHRGDTSTLVDDSIEFLNSKTSIIVGREFAQRRGLQIGSPLSLVTPTGVHVFTIRGLLDPEGLAKTLSGRLVVMDVYAAELAFTSRGKINQIDILVAKGRQHTVKSTLQSILPAGLRVEEPVLRKAIARRTIAGFQAMLTAFSLLAVLAGLLICYSQLATIFDARTWEIGLLRAVGLRRSVVFRELLKESLLLGILGTLCGIAFGRLIGEYALPVVTTTTALNFRLPLPDAVPRFTPGLFIVGLAVGIAAAVLAAALPALRLARTQPIAALRLRGREGTTSQSRYGGMIGLGLLVLAVILLWAQQVTGRDQLGIATTAVLASVACFAARPLVVLGSRLLTPVWAGLFGPSGTFAVRHVRQHVRRVALTTATLGIGLGAVMMFGMLAWSFERTLVRVLEDRMQADLVVNSAFAGSGYVGAPLDQALIEDLGRVPGVALASGERQRDVTYGDSDMVLDAYDPSCFTDKRVCQWLLENDAMPNALQLVARGEAVLVSSSFAHAYRTRPTDVLELSTPHGPIKRPVAGVTNGQPASAVILSRVVYGDLWNDRQLSWVHVAVDGNPIGVQQRVERTLGEKYRLRVRTSASLIEYFAEQARRAFQFVYIMEAILFLIVIVAIGDTLSTSVVERTRMFGMMRAVGLPRSGLFTMVLLEGAAIGLLGIVLALGMGTALGTFWVWVQFPALLGWRLQLHVPFEFLSAAAAVTLLLCIVASVLPSLRAGRLGVTSALRAE